VIATLFLRSALAAVAVLGGIGFLMALFFVLYGAPDVAMTQFAVETLIVIIFVLVIYHLPRLRKLTSGPRRAMDAIVASAFGAIMGTLAYAAATSDVALPVSQAHAVRSVPEGFGRNVVNVILVDFRALDTLGEILVLGIAAIGVYTLLRLRTHPRREASP
jgi:multicomponent Na+:H+ antiporter subunit A